MAKKTGVVIGIKPKHANARRGVKLRFTLSQPAAVAIQVQMRKGKRWVTSAGSRARTGGRAPTRSACASGSASASSSPASTARWSSRQPAPRKPSRAV